MLEIDIEQKENETIKDAILKDLKEKLESGEIDIDKYFHLKSLV